MSARILLIVFLIWTAVGAVVMPMGLDAAWVQRTFAEGILRSVFLVIERISDGVWMALAAANVVVALAAVDGWRKTLVVAGAVVVISGAAEWIGHETGWIFGHYEYSDRLGVRLGGVLPWPVPLAWLVVIAGSRAAAVYVTKNPWLLAVVACVIAVLTDINLEHVAWKVRGYWEWYPGETPAAGAWPPLHNFVGWSLVAFVLLVGPMRFLKPLPLGRPILVLALINALFLVTRWFA